MLNRLTCITVLSAALFGASAFAQSPCADAQLDANAKQTLARAELVLRQQSPAMYRAIFAAYTEACSPTELYAAGTLPGEAVPHIMAPVTCGAVFTFSTPAQARSVARYLRGKNFGGPVCVSVAQLNKTPIVRPGN